MADLKINQLDPVIGLSQTNFLADADLFIVKMKQRGTVTADEDRKLTWQQLVSSLNLGQYMQNAGGTFTGNIVLNNAKAVQGKQTGTGSAINLISVDGSNRLVVGSRTNQAQILSSVAPQWLDANGAYEIITTKNLPVPGALGDGAKGGAYTQTEVDTALAKKLNLTGGTMSGNLDFNNNRGVRIKMVDDTVKAVLNVNTNNDLTVGESALSMILRSNVVPVWNDGSASYDIITKNNLPTPGDISAYTKAEVNTIAQALLPKTGGVISGKLKLNNNQHFVTMSGASAHVPNTEVDVFYSGTNSIAFGDVDQSTTIRSYGKLKHEDETGSHFVYTDGNKPTTTELGIEDRLKLADTALQKDAYGFGGVPNHRKDTTFLTKTDITEFFVQNGASDEVRFGGLGAGIHMYYGTVGSGTSLQYRSASIFVTEANKLVTKWSVLDSNGQNPVTQTATYYSDKNKPTPAALGVYSKAEADGKYALKGVNSDITALNGITSNIRMGTSGDATYPDGAVTLRQLQQATGQTAGAVVGVVGGFIGAVMWFNGTDRSKIPAGWIAADGQQVAKTDAPDLWATVNSGALSSVSEALWLAGSTVGGKTTTWAFRGMYATTAASVATFRVPDLNGAQDGSATGLFLRGSGKPTVTAVTPKPGTVAKSSLPNITGGFTVRVPTGHTDKRTGVFIGNKGPQVAGAGSSSPARYPSILGSGDAIDAENYGFFMDASRPKEADGSGGSVIYGFEQNYLAMDGTQHVWAAEEVKPPQAVGIWIIRSTNNFEAASTNFTVHSGAKASADVQTIGGNLVSSFDAAGNVEHKVTLRSAKNGKGAAQSTSDKNVDASRAELWVADTLQNRNALYTFTCDGAVTANGTIASGIMQSGAAFTASNSSAGKPSAGTVVYGGLLRSSWHTTPDATDGTRVEQAAASIDVLQEIGKNYSRARLGVFHKGTTGTSGSDPDSLSYMYFDSKGKGLVPTSFHVGGTDPEIATTNQTAIQPGSIELSHSTPFIDFHFNNDNSDYTHRIICDGWRGLTVTKYGQKQGDDGTWFNVIGGYVCRQGLRDQSPPGNAFNIYHDGAPGIYIDNVDFGHINTTPRSDRELKKDIHYRTDADKALAEVMQWQVADFTYKERGNGVSPERKGNLGFIANDLVKVSPETVKGSGMTEGADVNDNAEVAKAFTLDQVALIAKLTQAVQALTARVQELETR